MEKRLRFALRSLPAGPPAAGRSELVSILLPDHPSACSYCRGHLSRSQKLTPNLAPPFGVRSCCQEVIQEEIKKLTQERTSLRKEMKSNRKKAKNAAKRKKRLVKARSSRYSGPVMSFALACIPPCTTCTGSQVAFQSGPPNPDPSQGER